MEKKLYLIENSGCDDTTRGIIELDDEEFLVFGRWVSDLNKNSTYGCMPRICMYELSWSEIKEIDSAFQTKSCFDDNYVDEHDILYYNHKKYTWADEYGKYESRRKIVLD